MIFDKTKIYTAANANELKAGDKVYVADNLYDLKCRVEQETRIAAIQEIYADDCNCRFKIKFGSSEDTECYAEYCLAYLVERKKEKKWRPYKNVDELLSDYDKKYRDTTGFHFIDNALCLPIIWIRERMSPFTSVGINGYDKISNQILSGTVGWYDLSRLFNVYEYLDGSPCGVEE